MGFCYDSHGRLCCDLCGSSGGVRKVRCPVNWCSPIAVCPKCRTEGKLKSVDHSSCRATQNKRAQDLKRFSDGGLDLTIRHKPDGSDRPYIVDGEWYFTACDFMERITPNQVCTWLTEHQLGVLRAIGHNLTIVEASQ